MSTAPEIDALIMPFCACGRVVSECDGSRKGCGKRHRCESCDGTGIYAKSGNKCIACRGTGTAS